MPSDFVVERNGLGKVVEEALDLVERGEDSFVLDLAGLCVLGVIVEIHCHGGCQLNLLFDDLAHHVELLDLLLERIECLLENLFLWLLTAHCLIRD